jgi:hypothetical protein
VSRPGSVCSPDGERILIVEDVAPDERLGALHLVTNWFEELRRKLPE